MDFDTFFKNQQSPLQLLESWIGEARADAKVKEPTAMSISTLNSNGAISSRIVLLKEIQSEELVFYTNYLSPKGEDLKLNPRIAALFYWDPLFRQVRIEGSVSLSSRQQSEEYWNSRPRESQLSQWISNQSRPAKDRHELTSLVDQARKDFDGKPIPCPEHWGGYQIQPDKIEFWVGQENRLHDRFLFLKQKGLWTAQRLFP
jgi:pyridoxamine 5'-phosphate oxidase